jgi:hypothetical protein
LNCRKILINEINTKCCETDLCNTNSRTINKLKNIQTGLICYNKYNYENISTTQRCGGGSCLIQRYPFDDDIVQSCISIDCQKVYKITNSTNIACCKQNLCNRVELLPSKSLNRTTTTTISTFSTSTRSDYSTVFSGSTTTKVISTLFSESISTTTSSTIFNCKNTTKSDATISSVCYTKILIFISFLILLK